MFKDPWASQELAVHGIDVAISNLADAQEWYEDMRYQDLINTIRGVRVKVSADLKASMKRIKEVDGE